MAWLERRGDRFQAVFRFRGVRFNVILKAADEREAKSCLARLEVNLRLVERGWMAVPPGADLGLYLLSDGILEQPVEVTRPVRLVEMFDLYRAEFTTGAKESVTREMENIHLNHLTRILSGDKPFAALTAGSAQTFVDDRSRELHLGHPVKPKTVRKAVANLRFVWDWAYRRGKVPIKFPDADLVFPKEKQPEPFRTYDQIQAILARGGIDKRHEREIWDGLFLNPSQVAEVLEHVRRKPNTKYPYPLIVMAAYTGGRRSELFRARVEDFDFGGRLVLLREKKRSRHKEAFRTVDMNRRSRR